MFEARKVPPGHATVIELRFALEIRVDQIRKESKSMYNRKIFRLMFNLPKPVLLTILRCVGLAPRRVV